MRQRKPPPFLWRKPSLNQSSTGSTTTIASIDMARTAAKQEGVADRVTFDVAAAKAFPGTDYDFVSVFDSLHDMGDPVGAVTHVRRAIKNGRIVDDCRTVCQ